MFTGFPQTLRQYGFKTDVRVLLDIYHTMEMGLVTNLRKVLLFSILLKVSFLRQKWKKICQVMHGIFCLMTRNPLTCIEHTSGMQNLTTTNEHLLLLFIRRWDARLNVTFV